MRLIRDGFLDDRTVEELATVRGIGARHLSRLFLRHVGATPTGVAITRRMQMAKRLVATTDRRLTEIALAAGFNSVRRFNDAFRKTYRRPPSTFRRNRPSEASH